MRTKYYKDDIVENIRDGEHPCYYVAEFKVVKNGDHGFWEGSFPKEKWLMVYNNQEYSINGITAMKNETVRLYHRPFKNHIRQLLFKIKSIFKSPNYKITKSEQ